MKKVQGVFYKLFFGIYMVLLFVFVILPHNLELYLSMLQTEQCMKSVSYFLDKSKCDRIHILNSISFKSWYCSLIMFILPQNNLSISDSNEIQIWFTCRDIMVWRLEKFKKKRLYFIVCTCHFYTAVYYAVSTKLL